MRLYLGIIFISLLLSSCVEVRNQFDTLPPGVWRATLSLTSSGAQQFINTDNETDRVFSELTDGELPFNFEVIYEEDGSLGLEVHNAAERIQVKDIAFGRDSRTLEDTVRIDFPEFDSYVSGIFEENRIQGYWHVNYRENYKIPFNAEFGKNHRFTNLKKDPIADLSGKWETTFELGTEDEYKGIGEFVQDGNKLSGTFRTETGDYRFLEGTVQGNKAYLSCFDGAHAFLFQAKILEDGSLTGSFRSGNHYLTTWNAVKNEQFELRDPDVLTFVKDQEKFFFNFENTKGEMVSLSDESFDNKAVLVSIFGTWCPNCRDEMEFLKSYFAEHPNLDIPVVAIAFERYREKEKSMAVLNRYIDKMDLPFEFLYGGYFEKSEAINQLPMLNKIISYPTMIILDKDKNIRKIHTGFSGPATSKFESFKADFDQTIKAISSEQEII